MRMYEQNVYAGVKLSYLRHRCRKQELIYDTAPHAADRPGTTIRSANGAKTGEIPSARPRQAYMRGSATRSSM